MELSADGARLLAAAGSAVAAVQARDAPQPSNSLLVAEPFTPQQCSPRRMCAAPGCGGTRGLHRCGGCGAVWYCGPGCSRAHWREHRAECRRLQAATAQAAAAADASHA